MNRDSGCGVESSSCTVVSHDPQTTGRHAAVTCLCGPWLGLAGMSPAGNSRDSKASDGALEAPWAQQHLGTLVAAERAESLLRKEFSFFPINEVAVSC